MEFESLSGVKYYYDDDIGLSFPFDPRLKALLQNIPPKEENYPDGVSNDELLFYSQFVKKLNTIRQVKPSPVHLPLQAEDVRQMVLHDGLYQMILGVTEDCNLRCRYCVYSDAYTRSRNPSAAMMGYETAKESVDAYFSLITEGRAHNPVRKPAIGFYGGEPLLNFNLIKKIVRYIETTYPEYQVTFSITTNGTLLNKERGAFLKEHGFLLNVSLDGPREEHDRNRVYPDGSGTFNDVMRNVQRIVRSGYNKDKISSICVFDWKSDLFRLDSFFRNPDIPKLSIVTTPSVQDGCVYYNRFSKEDLKHHLESEDAAFRYYLDHADESLKRHSVFEQLYALFASKFLYSTPTMILPENRVIPYSGACILGRKIFVDVHGTFHPCERINQSFPVGSVRTGLDFGAIASITNNYIDHLNTCPHCPVSKTCGYCYNHFALNGSFDYASDICIKEEAIKKFDFSRTFTLGERYPNLLDMVVRDYYTWLAKVSPTLGD